MAFIALATISAWIWWRQSLPVLDGKIDTGILSTPAVIQRDAQGVVMIQSADRNRSAFALGFLHAQERFFQMDLLLGNYRSLLVQLPWKKIKRIAGTSSRSSAKAPESSSLHLYAGHRPPSKQVLRWACPGDSCGPRF